MIDNASILFSTVMVVFVIYRAVRLDRDQPWFKPRRDVPKPGAAAPWRRV